MKNCACIIWNIIKHKVVIEKKTEQRINPLRLGETKIDQSYNYLLGEKLFFFFSYNYK